MSGLVKRVRAAWEALARYPPGGGLTAGYDAYWASRGLVRLECVGSYRRRRLDVLRSWVEPGAAILDVGCGDGVTMQCLAKASAPKGLLGVDVSPAAVEFVRGLGFQALCGDLRDPAVQRRLGVHDYVIATELLEHVAEAEATLALLASMARRSVIVSVPNTGYVVHRLRLLLGRFPVQWKLWPGEHVRFWTLADFRWMVGRLGLRVRRFAAYAGLPGRRLWPALLSHGLLFELEGTAAPSQGTP